MKRRLTHPTRCSSEYGPIKAPKKCGRLLFRYDVPRGRDFKRNAPLFLCPACDRHTLLAMGESL